MNNLLDCATFFDDIYEDASLILENATITLGESVEDYQYSLFEETKGDTVSSIRDTIKTTTKTIIEAIRNFFKKVFEFIKRLFKRKDNPLEVTKSILKKEPSLKNKKITIFYNRDAARNIAAEKSLLKRIRLKMKHGNDITNEVNELKAACKRAAVVSAISVSIATAITFIAKQVSFINKEYKDFEEDLTSIARSYPDYMTIQGTKGVLDLIDHFDQTVDPKAFHDMKMDNINRHYYAYVDSENGRLNGKLNKNLNNIIDSSLYEKRNHMNIIQQNLSKLYKFNNHNVKSIRERVLNAQAYPLSFIHPDSPNADKLTSGIEKMPAMRLKVDNMDDIDEKRRRIGDILDFDAQNLDEMVESAIMESNELVRETMLFLLED